MSVVKIKALSLWQPWASLIAFGLKQYETRSWHLSYNGPIAIAATKKQPCCISAQLEQIWRESGHDEKLKPLPESLPLPQGAIVAVAHGISSRKMINVAPTKEGQIYSGRNILIPAMSPLEIACGDWQEGRFAYRLIGAKATPVIPVRGGQGLWEVKDLTIVEILEDILYPNQPSRQNTPAPAGQLNLLDMEGDR